MRLRRTEAGLDVRTETYSSLRSTPTEFLFTASLEAFEGKERVYFNEWEKIFLRDLN
jgi:hypothetical protein